MHDLSNKNGQHCGLDGWNSNNQTQIFEFIMIINQQGNVKLFHCSVKVRKMVDSDKEKTFCNDSRYKF